MPDEDPFNILQFSYCKLYLYAALVAAAITAIVIALVG
jgi:hypothetical protein